MVVLQADNSGVRAGLMGSEGYDNINECQGSFGKESSGAMLSFSLET